MSTVLPAIAMSAFLSFSSVQTAAPVVEEKTTTEQVMETVVDVETFGVPVIFTAVAGESECYECKLISEMAGRAGSYTENGIKGIVFEIKYKDQNNIVNLFNDLTTKLSESSIDQVADLQVVDSEGTLVEQIQCKTGSRNYMRTVLDDVKNGKYADTKLVGTTEAANDFNQLAEKAGETVRMTDSGIKESTVEKLGKTCLGETFGSSLKTFAETALKTMGISALIGGGVAIVQSVINGDNAQDTAANALWTAGEGAVADGVGFAACGSITAICAAAGITGTVAVAILPVLAGIAAGIGVVFLIENVVDVDACKEAISNGISTATTWVADTAGNVAEVATETFDNVKDAVTGFFGAVAVYAQAACQTVSETVSDCASNACDAVATAFN